MSKNTYWSGMCCTTERDKANLKSWFGAICADMTPEKAEILCDVVTDKERKLRVVMVTKEGKRVICTRTMTKRGSTITIKPAKAA